MFSKKIILSFEVASLEENTKYLKKYQNIEKIFENIRKYLANMWFLAKYFILAKNGKICEKIFYIFSHIFPIPSNDSLGKFFARMNILKYELVNKIRKKQEKSWFFIIGRLLCKEKTCPFCNDIKIPMLCNTR